MSQLGMGAILESLGKKITGLHCDGGQLIISFEDTTLYLKDDAQSCCETRYMSTDDELEYYVGAELRGVRVQEGDGEESEWDCHDTEFLLIDTSIGTFTMVNHNEHNGYYGGFWLTASLE